MRLTFPDHFPDSLQLKVGGSLPGQLAILTLLIAACRRPYQYPFVGGSRRSAPIWGLVTLVRRRHGDNCRCRELKNAQWHPFSPNSEP
jgi:hypothetical protein